MKKRVSRAVHHLPMAGESRVSAGPASPPGPVAGVKGGGEKWLKMATAMESALDRLRTFYETLNALRPMGDGWGDQPMVQLHPAERQALLDEVAAAANILKAGLKAR